MSTRSKSTRHERAVIEALAFFELFGVGVSVDTLAVIVGSRGLAVTLDRLVERGWIDRVGSIVGLSRESIQRQRARSLISIEKRALARQFMARIGLVPFVRFIGLGNSVAFGSATALSDLDCFVVTASNRLWTARFLLLLRAKWLGLTKQSGASADRLDFGWWVDGTAFDLARGAISHDVHLRYWLACLVPLIDRDGTYRQLMAINRRVLARLSRWRIIQHATRITQHATRSLLERWLSGWIGTSLEWLLFVSQRAKIWAEPLARAPGADVVVTRHECKLHHLDERIRLRDRWRALVKKIERR